MKSLLDFIRPPEGASFKEVNRWRWNISLTLLALCLLSGWGFKSYARDDSVQPKISAAIGPISKELEAVKAEQGSQRTILEQTRVLAIENQAADYEGKIVDFKARQCKAPNDEAAKTWRDLVLDYQNRYLKLTGRNFPAPTCGEL